MSDERPNKDQIEGRTGQAAGEVKEVVGDATDNRDLEREGLGEQVAGKAQERDGDRKEEIADLTDDASTKALRDAVKNG